MGQFGGPIKFPGMANRPTVFLAYQRTSDHNVRRSRRWCRLRSRRGRRLFTALDGSDGRCQLIDPATGLPFAGNVDSRRTV